MQGICGADCTACGRKDTCGGCGTVCGSPRGGRCLAKEYIRVGGQQAYAAFKAQLLEEVNRLLSAEGLPLAEGLVELCGEDVNLAYPLPGGAAARFLNDRNIYLGTQIAFADMGICYGVVADASFILICSYSVDGSTPEIVLYKRR